MDSEANLKAVLVELRLRERHQLIDQHLRAVAGHQHVEQSAHRAVDRNGVERAAQAGAKGGTQLAAIARVQRPVQGSA